MIFPHRWPSTVVAWLQDHILDQFDGELLETVRFLSLAPGYRGSIGEWSVAIHVRPWVLENNDSIHTIHTAPHTNCNMKPEPLLQFFSQNCWHHPRSVYKRVSYPLHLCVFSMIVHRCIELLFSNNTFFQHWHGHQTLLGGLFMIHGWWTNSCSSCWARR